MPRTATGAIGAHNAKVMNRFELTKRLVAKLKHDEAVIGGIGNANFDLWIERPAAAEFLHARQHGPRRSRSRFGVALAQPQRHVIALEGDGSLLMQLGCLATVAMQAPKNLTMVVMGQRPLSDHRRPADRERVGRRSRRHRARLRHRQ